MRRVFLSGSGPEAETAWTRFAALLDDYLGQWSVMYSEACEATHVRGEQSQAVLDLRMRCLNDDLDEVRALTDVVTSRIDNASSMQALAAAGQLTPIRRCADLGVLKSLVPLPTTRRRCMPFKRSNRRSGRSARYTTREDGQKRCRRLVPSCRPWRRRATSRWWPTFS